MNESVCLGISVVWLLSMARVAYWLSRDKVRLSVGGEPLRDPSMSEVFVLMTLSPAFVIAHWYSKVNGR